MIKKNCFSGNKSREKHKSKGEYVPEDQIRTSN
jgi:hypothetical protein